MIIFDPEDTSPAWAACQLDWPQLTTQAWQVVAKTVPVALNWGQAEVSLLLADNNTIQQLNVQYRGQDKPTNVLSFPQYEADTDWASLPKDTLLMLGDIVLAAPYVPDEAAKDAKNLGNHVTHLLIHGLLHLLGYDHENDIDAQTMMALEIACLNLLNINNPYEC
jgi:probable rRNA maturation factor